MSFTNIAADTDLCMDGEASVGDVFGDANGDGKLDKLGHPEEEQSELTDAYCKYARRCSRIKSAPPGRTAGPCRG